MKKTQRAIIILIIFALLLVLGIAVFTVFFDEVVIVRKGTIYHINAINKLVALTFDDGPSPVWTPKILDELKKAHIKATFFMLGEHVAEYPDIARRVVAEGHEVGNHTYDHHILLYYTLDNLLKEINETQKVIKDKTGVKTKYFRPPKAWLTAEEKKEIEGMGYKIILWSLNSKDWVTFDDKYIVKYILKNVRPGDIILFHDSGGVFSTEGGDRHETVKTIPSLVEKLREKGFKFVTITELLNKQRR
jgi:peptidoglycan/xylan/chitin deacetylase (PgdA/CDA1 family)